MIKESNKKNYGRSMVEILAVLGLGAMMTIGVVWGVRVLMRKHQVNQIYDDIQQRVMFVSSRQSLLAVEPDSLIALGEFDKGNANKKYKIEAHRLDEVENEGAVFTMEISGITRKICRALLQKPFNTPYLLRIGGKEFNPEFPDFSVCNVFEDAKLDLIVSTAYAEETKEDPKFVISYRPDEYIEDSGALESAEVEKASKDCKKKGGEYSSVLGKCCSGGIARNKQNNHQCCENGNESVAVIGNVSETLCCKSGEKAFESNGSYSCCAGEVFRDAEGNYACCEGSDRRAVKVAGQSDKRVCCSVKIGKDGSYDTIGYYPEGSKMPVCCTGTVATVRDKQYCCGKDQIKLSVFEGNGDEFCCSEGQEPYLSETGPVCCDGKPYKAASLTSDKSSMAVKCCEKDKDLVDVIGKANQKECCPKGQKAYWDGQKTECRDGCKSGEVEVGKDKNKTCCPEVAECKTYNYKNCACLTCNKGFSYAAQGSKCCPTIDGCASYNSETCVCEKCYSGQFLNDEGKCVSCPIKVDYCDEYDDQCKCKRCAFNSMTFEHSYANNTGTACCNGITSCAAYGDNCQCIACEDGYKFGESSSGYGIIECIKNQTECFTDSRGYSSRNPYTGECSNCPSHYLIIGSDGRISRTGMCCAKTEHCTKYVTGAWGTCDCMECESGYSLENGVCKKLCKKYDMYGRTCVECIAGYSFNAITGKCEGTGACLEYSPYGDKCLKCVDGYKLNKETGECEEGEEPCLVSDLYGECLKCADGYALDNGECFGACREYDMYGDCKECSKGYGFPSTGCQKCVKYEHCTEYSRENCRCTTCEQGYGLMGCNSFYSFCTQCTNNIEHCMSTITGSTVGNGSLDEACISPKPHECICGVCEEGYIPSSDKKACCKKKANCLEYDADCKCTRCDDDGEYKPTNKGTCIKCNKNYDDVASCAVVNSSKKNGKCVCVECQEGKFLFDCGNNEMACIEINTDLESVCSEVDRVTTDIYGETCDGYKKWLECLKDKNLCTCIAEDSKCM